MTPQEHDDQRSRVAGSLRADEGRDHHRDVYVKHPLAQVIPMGEPTVASLAQSIRELGEMLAVADAHPVWSERLLEVERLALRVGSRAGAVLDLVRAEYRSAA